MTTPTISSRRSFIWTAGAALSAPLAAAATVPAGTGSSGNTAEARLAMLEDVNAIRALNQAYARHVNAGDRVQAAALFIDAAEAMLDEKVVGLVPDQCGELDVIEIAADRMTATARLHFAVDAEESIGPDCTLLDMARQQGGGVVSRTERGVFEQACVRRDGVWKIQRSTYRRL